MSMTLHVDIVSLEQQIFSGLALAVFATGRLGELGIYPGHAQLLSSLKPGVVRILRENNEEEIYYVEGGLIEVQPTTVSILADVVVRAAEIDEAKAMEAKERAEKELANKKSDFDYSRAAAELAQAIAQLRTIQKLRSKYKV